MWISQESTQIWSEMSLLAKFFPRFSNAVTFDDLLNYFVCCLFICLFISYYFCFYSCFIYNY